MLSSLFHLARLLGALAEAEVARDGSLVALGFWQSLWKDFLNILVSAEAKRYFRNMRPLNIETHVHFMGNSVHMFPGYLSLMYSNAIL